MFYIELSVHTHHFSAFIYNENTERLLSSWH